MENIAAIWQTRGLKMTKSPPAAPNASELPPSAPPASVDPTASPQPATPGLPREIGGREGPEPTRYGDWEKAGRCIDF